MSKRSIIALKLLLHLLCLTPFAYLLYLFRSGALALNPDPVNLITHFTGDWTLYLLLATLAITPLRRLSPRISFLVRFRRLIGLYAKSADKQRFPLLPTYDHVLKCSNLFNTLDARGAISVTERVGVIGRVRKLAVGLAEAWVDQQAVAA